MAAAHLDRRMLAILAADMVGYSRLMEIDEPGTIARLKAVRGEVAEPLIAEHHGRLVKLMGDGALVVFDSVVDAVTCAVEIQKAVGARNAALPEPERIVFRIGVNLGDVARVDGDVYGDGVNIAARLEQACEPGGVVISGTAFDHMQGKLDVPLEPAGKLKVKNLARPVRAYRVRVDGAGHRRRAPVRWRIPGAVAAVLVILPLLAGGWWWLRPVPPAAAAPSLAVLPFNNMSGDPALDYFSDGLTEDLTTQLSRNPELRVVARSSAFVYKGQPVDVKEVGRTLGARFVLEGSVRTSGDTARITAQLIDAFTGHHVWAERFDEQGSDVFALQDRVTQRVVGAVAGERGLVRAAGHQEAFEKPSADLAEYDYFLRVHALIYRYTKEDALEAQRVAREGLVRFPDSALLRVKLGWTHMVMVRLEWSTDRPRDLSEAYRLASQALADRSLPMLGRAHGHWLLAHVLTWHQRDFERAQAERRSALVLAPNDPDIMGDLCEVALFAGRPDEVIESLPDALAAVPAFAAQDWPHWTLAFAYVMKHRYEDAMATAGRAAEPSRLTLAASLAKFGRLEEARNALREALAREQPFDFARTAMLNPSLFKNGADIAGYLENLRKAGLPER